MGKRGTERQSDRKTERQRQTDRQKEREGGRKEIVEQRKINWEEIERE